MHLSVAITKAYLNLVPAFPPKYWTAPKAEMCLLSHGQNKGYVEALRSGADAASMEWIFFDGFRRAV